VADEWNAMSEPVRKGTRKQQLHEIGDVLAWLTSLANQFNIDPARLQNASHKDVHGAQEHHTFAKPHNRETLVVSPMRRQQYLELELVYQYWHHLVY
jgi:hypothetical protein